MSILLRDDISVLEKPIKLRLKKRKWPLEPGKLRHDVLNTDNYYQVNNLKFEVSQRGYNVLIAGLPYRLYYAPNSKSIVSIEPLTLADAETRNT